MVFAIRLRQLRKKHKLIQKQMAELLDITVATYSNYENGIYTPDLESAIRIADYFEVSLDYLVGRTDANFNFSLLNLQISDHISLGDFFVYSSRLSQSQLLYLLDYMKYLNFKKKTGVYDTDLTNPKFVADEM